MKWLAGGVISLGIGLLAATAVTKSASFTRNVPQFRLDHTASGQVEQELELSIDARNATEKVYASLSLDGGNRHAVIDSLDLPGNIESITLDRERQLAFLANSHSGVHVLDISDPTRNSLVGALSFIGNAWDIKHRDNILFVAASRGGLKIIDTNDPHTPQLISELILPDTPLLKLAVYHDTIYATSGKNGLVIIDISNLKQPRHVSTIHPPKGAWGLTTVDDTLVLSCGRFKINTYSISDPYHPRLTKSLPISDRVWQFASKGDILYAPTRNEGLFVLDFHDRANPIRLDSFATNDIVETISVEGDRLLLGNRYGELHIYDISEPGTPVRTLKADLAFRSRDVAIHGNLGYVASGITGLQVVDLSKVTANTLPALNLNGALAVVDETEGYYFLGTSEGSLIVARKVEQQELPEIVSRLTIPFRLRAMVRNGNYLYLSCSQFGLRVIDISEPEHPHLEEEFEYSAPTRDIAVVANRLYVSTRDGGLLIFDISNPQHPALIKTAPYKGLAKLLISDDRLYSVSTDRGLHNFDISDPENPIELHHLPLPWPLRDFINFSHLAKTEDTIYLAAGTAGLLIFDVSDKDRSELIDTVYFGSETISVATRDDNVYVTTRLGKLWILSRGENGELLTKACANTNGKSHSIKFINDSNLLMSNGLKGLALMTLPQQLEVVPDTSSTLRARTIEQLSIKIPPLATPGHYDLAIISGGKSTEFINAVTIEEQ